VVAVVQVLPLLVDTSTISPDTKLALVVPEIVCAAVLVLKSGTRCSCVCTEGA